MRTVLLVEDSFLESYELEYRLRELGYEVELAATLEIATERFRVLERTLAAVVCDNRLVNGKPVASKFYAHVRARRPSMPFVVYSGFPPADLPQDDPLLAVVRKPFMDEVITQLRRSALIVDNSKTVMPTPCHREAA
jgi:DNA-binding NtrC family response regulator